MDSTQSIAIVLGGTLPFLISFVKRFIKMDEQTSYSLVFGLCIAVTVGLRLAQNNWEWSLILMDFSGLVMASQVMYSKVMRQFDMDKAIEDISTPKDTKVESGIEIKAVK